MAGFNELNVLPEESLDVEQMFTETKFLGFFLNGEEYITDLMSIQEIISPVPITYIPRMPGYIAGIITLRGEIVPIFDLKKRLNLVAGEVNKNGRIIVVSLGKRVAGAMVDSVTDVMRMKADELEPPPCNVAGKKGELIKGIGTYKGRMVILIDFERAFSHGK